MINAAITPGTHPQRVNKVTIIMLPHPWSKTAKGGRMMDKSTLKQPINSDLKGHHYI